MMAPHRAWVEGRAALETLEAGQIGRAIRDFEQVLEAFPDNALAHVGLANAFAMRYETTRTDATPDTTSLAHAADHAREACRLDPGLAEAWATLGFVHGCQAQPLEALAALRRAVTMEPDNWRHQFRLAFASWGEERLRAARRTLAMLPGFPLAHFLAATVHVARNLLADAERELRAGIVGQDAQGAHARFTAVALHWLLGLVLLAKGDEEGAVAEFERELAAEASGHLYSRECCANTCYAIGALRLRQGREMEAQQAFAEALRRVPNHRLVTVVAGARKLAASRQRHSVSHAALDVFTNKDGPFDERFVLGIALAAIGETTRAIAMIDEAMVDAPPGSAGWLLPVEPLLNVRANPEAWTSALARLQARVA
jgi:tetratricopeptide (TPR) repeat protein